MPILEVLDTGPLTTIQDTGRFGLRAFGVSQAGPMDQLAFDMANLLVGNVQSAAAIEFASNGGRFRFDTNTAVAVTGPGVVLSIEGVAMDTNQTLKRESRVSQHAACDGGRPPIPDTELTHGIYDCKIHFMICIHVTLSSHDV